MQGAIQIHGMGYVPGVAHGRLRRAAARPGRDEILLVTQEDALGCGGDPAAIIVIDGAPFSHRMIGLLGRAVPTVIVTAAQAAALPDGAMLTVDGASGAIISGLMIATAPIPGFPPGAALVSADGVAVELRASVRSAAAAAQAVREGAAAIGLVRSEYLLPDDGPPLDALYWTREFDALCRVVEPLSVTIRLLDAAPDKMPAWLRGLAGTGVPLGLQGVRLFDSEPIASVVAAQLDAIAALTARYPLQILIPYLTSYEELCRWAEHIAGRMPAALPIGAMAETPAAVLDIAQWLDVADFVAIGCNDLMQALFAADRDQPGVRRYLDPYAPVLYRLLRQVAQAAGERLARVQLCGVLPQLHGVLPVLLGLGYRVFSVDSGLLPYLGQSVRTTRLGDALSLAEAVCAARLSSDVRQLVLESLGGPG